jgi:hypothetical protein
MPAAASPASAVKAAAAKAPAVENTAVKATPASMKLGLSRHRDRREHLRHSERSNRRD